MRFWTGKGREEALAVAPCCLEYSEKDDRFRLVASGDRRDWVVDLSRLTKCVPAEGEQHAESRPVQRRSVIFELTDTRNALERVLLHFSHLQKETERLDDSHYRITLQYDPQDEIEMVIRMLSFGPVVKVSAPAHFIDLMRTRIEKQLQFATFLPG